MTAQAWAWVAHLRGGGTTEWAAWRQRGSGEATPDVDAGRFLPGSQQLELLRRLNQVARPPAALAERVLGASAPGRGIADLELVGAARAVPFGPRPVDPATLPASELVRVASGLLADDLVESGPLGPASAGRPWPWRRRYRLVGDPWIADTARDELVRRGRPPGGQSPVVHVVGTDLATMYAHAWTARCFADGGPGWPEWLEPLARSGRVPPRTDLAAVARTWAGRVGPEQVRVVLDPDLLQGLLATRRPLPAPPAHGADAVDLTRRVGAALGLLVLPEARAGLLRHRWGPRLAALPRSRAGAPPVTVPERHHERVVARAERMRDELLRAGYPLHGDPDLLLPRPAAASGSAEVLPTEDGVLRLALDLLLEGSRPVEGER